MPSTPRTPWREVARSLLNELINGTVLDEAAQLSYYFLFSLFPLLFFLVALTPYLPLQDTINDVLQRAAPLLPGQALSIVQGHLTDLVNNPRPKLLSLGLVLALWSASRGVNAFRTGLNQAYGVPETRPWWKVQLLCIGMLLFTTLLVLLCLAVVTLGSQIGAWILSGLPGGRQLLVLGAWLRWPISALVISGALGLNYYLLPDRRPALAHILPGALVSMLLWLLCTWGFSKYVERFGNYNVTYGSIGGVVVLMTWLYLTGLIFLLGGKLTALQAPVAATPQGPGSSPAARA